jgi:ATP-binding cassette subfamily C protein CydD
MSSPALFLWQHTLRAGRRYLLRALLSAALAGTVSILATLWLARALATLLSAPAQPDMVLLLVIGFVLCAGVRALLVLLADLNGAKASAAVRANLRHQLYRAIMERGPVGISENTSGELSTLLFDKVEACDAYVSRYYTQLMTTAVVVPVVLLLVGSFDLKAAGILLIGAMVLPLLLGVFGYLTGRASKAQMVALTRMGVQFADRLRNLTLLRTHSATDRALAELGMTADNFRSRTMTVLRIAFLSASVMDVVQACLLVSMALYLYHADLPLPVALALLLLTLEFFAPLRALSSSYHDRATALTAATDLIPWLTQTHPAYAEGNRPAPAPLLKPSLELLKVSYTYPGRETPALQDFSLRVEGGELLALTGPSGSGKSTILHLLLGFIRPDRGMLVLAQQPLHLIEASQRGAAFAYVGQRTRLFHGTLEDNIRLGHPAAGHAAITAAIRAARLDSLIAELPDGLHTLIGEGGFGLSGGQAQRVALARAFLRGAPVLLLDEPTTGLDRDTASELLETIRLLAMERTVIMATHDPAALRIAERIVRLGVAA